ncbi:MAG: Hsp70 family protein [Candidatus Dormibacteraeota bacterium]|nr:Hsp70 family protein [Candidatus Dormibacteraeota bacterium]MBO0708772.1 Hsp70 family protein [Candidatus Dormibacteraeota bacterium]
MAAPLGYGIDFGTSNSAVAIASVDGVEVLPIAGDPNLPSQVYLHRERPHLAGVEAVRTFLTSGHERHFCDRCSLAPYGGAETRCRQFRKAGGCNDARLLSGVKYELPSTGYTGTNSWARDWSVPDLVGIVLERLKWEADRRTGCDVRRLVLGHPVVFAGLDSEGTAAPEARTAEGERLAWERLRGAAHGAGFEEVVLLPEPAAALLGEERRGQLELALDFGGGTFDAAVMDGRQGPPRVTGLAGAPVGGEVLDGVLFEAKVAHSLGFERLPAWLCNGMRTQSAARLLLADPGIPAVLDAVGGAAAQAARRILLEGGAYDFYRSIERAKIALSSSDEAVIQHAPTGLEVRVRRGGFEAMIGPELDLVMEATDRALAEAGVDDTDVDRVLLTGGSSQIPAFRRRLTARFGQERLEERDAFTAVVRGLGAHARATWAA